MSFFTSPDGTNPDFTLASGSALVGKGGSGSGVPSNDIGFDPKCITKKTPTPPGMMAKGSWWQYSVDLTYIKSIGGVAGCFHAKNRSGTPDIGAYANGSVTKAGTCTPPPPPPGTGGTTGTGGSGTGGTTGAGGATAARPEAVSGGSVGTGSGGNGGDQGHRHGGTTSGSGGANERKWWNERKRRIGRRQRRNRWDRQRRQRRGRDRLGLRRSRHLHRRLRGQPIWRGRHGTSATGGASGDNGATSGSSSGCACAVASGSSSSLAGFCALGLGLLMLRRRRRSR